MFFFQNGQKYQHNEKQIEAPWPHGPQCFFFAFRILLQNIHKYLKPIQSIKKIRDQSNRIRETIKKFTINQK